MDTRIVRYMDTDGFALNFVVDPRQVGKTMLLLIFIHKEFD